MNTLESRTLHERMARHRAIADLLKQPEDFDDFSDDEDMPKKKNVSALDQQLIDNEKAKNSKEF